MEEEGKYNYLLKRRAIRKWVELDKNLFKLNTNGKGNFLYKWVLIIKALGYWENWVLRTTNTKEIWLIKICMGGTRVFRSHWFQNLCLISLIDSFFYFIRIEFRLKWNRWWNAMKNNIITQSYSRQYWINCESEKYVKSEIINL